MLTPADIRLLPAGTEQLPVIENLMQFYIYDFSQWYPAGFAENGLFQLRPKTEYWAQAGVYPYLIYAGDELAGFAIVDNDCVNAKSQHSLAYYFIARRFRAQGAAARALTQLFAVHPGSWEIYHYCCNLPAARFWQKVLPQLASDLHSSTLTLDDEPCQLYRFHISPFTPPC